MTAVRSNTRMKEVQFFPVTDLIPLIETGIVCYKTDTQWVNAI
jgi:hypothetical protein